MPKFTSNGGFTGLSAAVNRIEQSCIRLGLEASRDWSRLSASQYLTISEPDRLDDEDFEPKSFKVRFSGHSLPPRCEAPDFTVWSPDDVLDCLAAIGRFFGRELPLGTRQAIARRDRKAEEARIRAEEDRRQAEIAAAVREERMVRQAAETRDKVRAILVERWPEAVIEGHRVRYPYVDYDGRIAWVETYALPRLVGERIKRLRKQGRVAPPAGWLKEDHRAAARDLAIPLVAAPGPERRQQ